MPDWYEKHFSGAQSYIVSGVWVKNREARKLKLSGGEFVGLQQLIHLMSLSEITFLKNYDANADGVSSVALFFSIEFFDASRNKVGRLESNGLRRLVINGEHLYVTNNSKAMSAILELLDKKYEMVRK